MRTLLRCAALAGVTALALAGCSSDEPSGPAAAPTTGRSTGSAPTATGTPSPTPTNQPPTGGETDGDQPKACSLVTGAEAATALGRPVGPPEDRGLSAFSSCAFTASSGRPATVTVQVLQSPATASTFDRIVASQPGGSLARPVPSVGDKAVLAAGMLLFRKRGTVVTVLIFSPDQPGRHTAAAITLGRKIAAKV